MLPKTAEVVIIGGGVMGVSTAYHLARRGGRDVLLLEKAEFFGQGATGQCAGGIRHQFSTEVNVRLSIHSIRMLERFPEEIGQEVGLNQCGYLLLLSTDQDVAMFRENVALQHRLGVATRWLSVDDIARLVPQVNLDGILAATFYQRDGLADPGSVVQGYVGQARRLGATLLNGVEVASIQVEGGRVRSVVTNQGEVAAPVVVIAAGPWSGDVARTAGIDLPVRPLRRQIAVTRPIPGLPRDFPFVIDFAQSLYFHYESGGILTGMSNPNETFGYKLDVDREWTLTHLEKAVERLPLLADAELLTEWAGLYEVTPDDQAILGRIPEVEGLISVTGFSGHGFMHGPICGRLMAEEILDGQAHTVNIDALRFDRFQKGRDVAEYNVI
jgi:sarcosine oxidase subunit beta